MPINDRFLTKQIDTFIRNPLPQHVLGCVKGRSKSIGKGKVIPLQARCGPEVG